MLNSVIICEDQELSNRLSTALEATGQVSIRQRLNHYPTAIELMRTLQPRTHDVIIDVIFLSFESAEKARALLETLEAKGNGAHVFGISRDVNVAILLDMMRAGVRECLHEPFDRQRLADSLRHLGAKADTHRKTAPVFSFLPSKAGVGTSTIALNVSAALTRQHGARVLLLDFDLSSGMLDFMLKLENEHSVMDVLERVDDLDDDLWSRLVSSVDKLDVLHARTTKGNMPVEASRLRKLIASRGGFYKAVCFDLSGNMEPYSIDILNESQRIILACTPECSSLHLARKKLSVLRELQLEDRVAVVVNRCAKEDILNQRQIEGLLGAPVVKMIPNNYREVNRAIEAGKCVPAESTLGRVFEKFASDLLERRVRVDRRVPKTSPDWKTTFVEFLSTARRSIL